MDDEGEVITIAELVKRAGYNRHNVMRDLRVLVDTGRVREILQEDQRAEESLKEYTAILAGRKKYSRPEVGPVNPSLMNKFALGLPQ